MPVPQHLQKTSRGRVRSFPPGEGDNLAEEDSTAFEPRWRPCRLVHRREHCKAEEQDGTTRAREEAGVGRGVWKSADAEFGRTAESDDQVIE